MAQEHQEYIQTKVNPTLENLVTQVLLERPENPVPFMVKWLAEQTKGGKTLLQEFGVGEAQQLRSEISALTAEVKELELKLGSASGSVPAPAGVGAGADDDEEDDEDDIIDELPDLPASKAGMRGSVSAEAYGDWNKFQAFTPPVYPKSEEQKERILNVLRKTFLFEPLAQGELDIIVGAMVEKTCEAKERIIQEGEDGEHMFVIEVGSVQCKKRIDGQLKVVKECGEGDIFGELALLYNCPRSASVDAKEKLVLWQLDRLTFNHIVRDASVKKREMYGEFLKSVPLLEALGDYERSQLADTVKREVAAAGTVVIKQGEEGHRFYVVESGDLVAQKAASADEEAKDVMTYKAGDYFGELALLHGDVRAASVVAKTESTLLWVDRAIFNRLLGSLRERMTAAAGDAYK